MMRKKTVLFLGIGLVTLVACGKEPTAPDPDMVTVTGTVRNMTDSSAVSEANITIYDANTNAPVTRTLTDTGGFYHLSVEAGAYYIKMAAQGYIPSPPPGGAPVPFQADAAVDTTITNIFLKVDASASSTGSLSGTVALADETGISGFLIIATHSSGSQVMSTTSGPDGFYVLYNLLPGLHTIKCLRAGYKQTTTPIQFTVYADSSVKLADIAIEIIQGARLSGQITFLASPNATVDITLIDPDSREAIPGLYTFNNGTSYALDSIPPGTFLAWATYQNDGYVMDPDWIAKNGLPYVTFSESDLSQTRDFSVTDAIIINSPTNEADSIYPVEINTTTPSFSWTDYPQPKEYIIEVRNRNGERIWGGYDANGTILHPQIGKDDSPVLFDFDGSAIEPLRDGGIYQWKIYGDDSADPNIQTLLSSSEDQLGLFKVVLDTSANP
ncbi:carboxypeptidase regulatory-like domain-containing protein [Fibrobacterota bacterium]